MFRPFLIEEKNEEPMREGDGLTSDRWGPKINEHAVEGK
jgi:hypothetical protein